MTGTIGLTEAAQALGEYFGPRFVTGRAEGRQLMADALHERFSISSKDATRLIEALEHAGSIRWVDDPSHTPEAAVAIQGPIRPVWTEEQDVGYWQLEPE